MCTLCVTPCRVLPSVYSGHPAGRSLVSRNSSDGHFAGVSTPAIAWNAITSSGERVGIEVDGQRFDQGRAIRPGQRVEPGMLRVGDPAALQPDPDGAIEPAGHRGELIQHRLAQEEAFTLRGDCSEPQFATLVAAVNDGAPTEAGHAVLVPVQDLEELIASVRRRRAAIAWRPPAGKRLPYPPRGGASPPYSAECGPDGRQFPPLAPARGPGHIPPAAETARFRGRPPPPITTRP